MLNTDWRNMENGLRIPTETGYCDQPSIVKTARGVWVCSVTTGKGGEGAKGQYVNITRSFDRGQTWTSPISLEDTDWESAYSSLAIAPSGRIYCFYCYNMDHIDIDKVPLSRYDMGGYYCYRMSADDGETWSERHVVPIRDFEIDEQQEYKDFAGKPLRFFWNVSRVFFEGDTLYSALIKYHYKPEDVLFASEGALLRCRNLDTDPDAVWETLPNGKKGIRTPEGGGRVAEEQSYVILSDGTIFTVFRTIDGFSACAYSRDGGCSFEPSDYMRYSDRRRVKHNRAANFIWPLGDGKYLYWFNNQGTRSYMRRNPIWCLLGTEIPAEKGMRLTFSEPELLLYHDSEHVMMSYPDLLWDDGWYVTETQKVEARIHPIQPAFIERLTQPRGTDVTPVWQLSKAEFPMLLFSKSSHAVMNDHRILTGNGLTLCLRIQDAKKGDVLFDTRTGNGGIGIWVNETGLLEAEFGDVMVSEVLHGSRMIADGAVHSVALVIDAQAKVYWFVVDGRFDDGGERQMCGWRWLNRSLIELPQGMVRTGRCVQRAQAFDRPLMTCEIAKQ